MRKHYLEMHIIQFSWKKKIKIKNQTELILKPNRSNHNGTTQFKDLKGLDF